MSRIMGQPVESKNETTATQSALQQLHHRKVNKFGNYFTDS